MSHVHTAGIFRTAATGLTYAHDGEGAAAAAATAAAPDTSTTSDTGAALPMINDKESLYIQNALVSRQIRQQHRHLTSGTVIA